LWRSEPTPVAGNGGDRGQFYDKHYSQQYYRAQLGLGAIMPTHSFMQPGAFEPEAIAAMSEAFDAACESQREVVREVIARRIIAAARFGERDPVRLLEAALRKPD
jgi:hypothetical protein